MKKTITICLSLFTLAFSNLNAQNLHMVNGNASDFGFDYDAGTGIVSNLFFTFAEGEGTGVFDDFTISWGVQSDINDFGTYIEIDRQIFTDGINGGSSFLLNNWPTKNLNDNWDITDGSYYLVGIVDTENDISESDESQVDNGMLLASDASGKINYTSGALSTITVSDNMTNVQTFPNPFQNELTIDVGVVESQTVTVELVDIVGDVVLSTTVQANSSKSTPLTLDTSSLGVGLYVAKITTSQGVITRKVIKK